MNYGAFSDLENQTDVHDYYSFVKSLRHKKGRFETVYLFKLMKKIHDL